MTICPVAILRSGKPVSYDVADFKGPASLNMNAFLDKLDDGLKKAMK